MPSEGIELSQDGSLLTNTEVLRLAGLFVRSGVTKIRLTGGEPTVRKGIIELVGAYTFAELTFPAEFRGGAFNQLKQHGLMYLAMTTNGIALHRRLPALVENGLTHLNLSLDTLDPFKFEIITRRRGHDTVLRTLDLALQLPIKAIKLNVVVIKGLNDVEALNFVELTRHKPISVRFIEFMPFMGLSSLFGELAPSHS